VDWRWALALFHQLVLSDPTPVTGDGAHQGCHCDSFSTCNQRVLLGIHEHHLQAYAKRRGWDLSINKGDSVVEDLTCKCLDPCLTVKCCTVSQYNNTGDLQVLLAGPSEEHLKFLSSVFATSSNHSLTTTSMFHAEYGSLVTSEVADMCKRTIEALEFDDRPLYVIYGLPRIAQQFVSTFDREPWRLSVVPNKLPSQYGAIKILTVLNMKPVLLVLELDDRLLCGSVGQQLVQKLCQLECIQGVAQIKVCSVPQSQQQPEQQVTQRPSKRGPNQ
jgi:hypothetical protein